MQRHGGIKIENAGDIARWLGSVDGRPVTFDGSRGCKRPDRCIATARAKRLRALCDTLFETSGKTVDRRGRRGSTYSYEAAHVLHVRTIREQIIGGQLPLGKFK